VLVAPRLAFSLASSSSLPTAGLAAFVFAAFGLDMPARERAMPAFFLSIVLFATLLPSFLVPALAGPAFQGHRICPAHRGARLSVPRILFCFPVRCLRPASSAELAQFQPIRSILFILLGDVIALLTHRAGERNHNTVLFTFGCHRVSPFTSSASGCCILPLRESSQIPGLRAIV
jgi:hypothetical protein